MKKNTKILVFVLSLALLLSAAIAVSANTEAAAPEIMAKNVVYGADIRFQFAIDATDLGADKEIIVKIYDADPAGNANLLDSAVAVYDADVTDTNLGVQAAYIVEKTNAAISAVAFGQEFWAVAECDGKQGKAIKYSAVEYFLERLYADADKITDLQKEHYENAIAYGSTAQKVTGDTKTNVADYLYVGGKDAEVLIDGVSVGEGAIVLVGDKFALKPIGTIAPGYSPLWKDATGSTIKGTSEITASASGIYSYTLIPMLTFDGMADRQLTVFANTNTSWASQKYIEIGEGYNNIFRAWNGSVGTKNNPTAEIENGKLTINSDDGSDYLEIHPTYTESGYNLSTFEADITFGSTGNFTTDLRASNGSTAIRFQNFIYNMSTGAFKWNATNASGGTGSTISKTLATTGDRAHTLNLKVEFYTDGTDVLVSFYFDGELVYIIASELCTDSTSGNMDGTNTDGVKCSGTRYYAYNNNTAGKEAPLTDFSAFHMLFNSSNTGFVSFDNVSFTQVKVNEKPDINITLK